MRGDLTRDCLPDVIRHIYLERRSGSLRLIQDHTRKEIFFELGAMVFAASNRREDRIGETMMRHGTLSKEDFERVQAHMGRGKRFGKLLVDLQLISERDLIANVTFQVLDIIYSVFNWTLGGYEFIEIEKSISEDLKLELSTASIILEGVRRIDDLNVIERGLGDLNRLIGPSINPLLRLQTLSLKPLERQIIEMTREPVSLFHLLVSLKASAEAVLRSVYGLLSAGVLERYAAAEVSRHSGRLIVPEEVRQTIAQEEPPPVVSTRGTGAHKVDEMALRRRIELMRAKIAEGNFYELLDATPEMSKEELHNAYYKLAREFHPDRHQQASKELRAEIDEIFNDLSNCYEALRNPPVLSDLSDLLTPQPQAALLTPPERPALRPLPIRPTGPKPVVPPPPPSFPVAPKPPESLQGHKQGHKQGQPAHPVEPIQPAELIASDRTEPLSEPPIAETITPPISEPVSEPMAEPISELVAGQSHEEEYETDGRIDTLPDDSPLPVVPEQDTELELEMNLQLEIESLSGFTPPASSQSALKQRTGSNPVINPETTARLGSLMDKLAQPPANINIEPLSPPPPAASSIKKLELPAFTFEAEENAAPAKPTAKDYENMMAAEIIPPPELATVTGSQPALPAAETPATTTPPAEPVAQLATPTEPPVAPTTTLAVEPAVAPSVEPINETRPLTSTKSHSIVTPEEQQRAEQLFADGRNYFQAKDYPAAARCLREAVRLDPGQLRYRLLLGHILGNNQRWHKEAEEQFRRVLELDAFNAMAHVGLGQLYLKVGLDRRAETEFREALKLEPNNSVAKKGLQSLQRNEPPPAGSTSFLTKLFKK